MPSYDDENRDGDRTESKFSERGASGGKGDMTLRESTSRKRNDKEDEERRFLRWTSFTKPKLVLGFDLLSPAWVPSMGNKTKGYSIAFERVLGFPVPNSLLSDVDQGGYEVSVQLSLSLFHMNSVSFFGSTWMGAPVLLTKGSGKQLPREVDFDCNELVYLMSRITDPTCLGIVEVVMSKRQISSDVIVAQYGCGWTMLNIFAVQPEPADIAEGHENVTVSVSVLVDWT
jgi:hypothetical protein